MATGWDAADDMEWGAPTLLDGAEFGRLPPGGEVQGPPAPGMTWTEAMQIGGPVVAMLGAVSSAAGTYFQAQAQRDQMASQASSFEFKRAMSQLNAQRAASLAEYIQFAGSQKAGAAGLRSGQAREALRASMAARGVQLGVGSAQETMVSFETMRAIDLLTMDANTMRTVEAARTQQQNLLAQSMMEGVSASNLMMARDTISPVGVAGASLLGSAGSVAAAWYQNNLMNQLIARNTLK